MKIYSIITQVIADYEYIVEGNTEEEAINNLWNGNYESSEIIDEREEQIVEVNEKGTEDA